MIPTPVFQVAFSTDPGASQPDWVDLSSRVRDYRRKTGRQRSLDQIQASTLDVTLDNRDRALDPTYSFSPFAPNVVPRRECRFGLRFDYSTPGLIPTHGFETGTSGWFTYGSATLTQSSAEALFGSFSGRTVTGGVGPVEGPATHPLAAASTRYRTAVWVKAPLGASMLWEIDAYSSTDASVYISAPVFRTFTGTGQWQLLEDEYVTPAGTQSLDIGVYTNTVQAITFYVDTIPGEVFWRFRGYVERFPPEWQTRNLSSVTIPCVDGLALLAKAQIVGSFPQELSGSRIDRVIAAAGWPDATPIGSGWTLGASALGTGTILGFSEPASVLDAGDTVIPAQTFAEADEQMALDHLQEVMAAERGLLYIDPEGRFIFQERSYRFNRASVLTFDPTGNATEPGYRPGIQPSSDAERIANEVIVTREGGAAQTASDGVSQARFWRNSLPLRLLLLTDAEALDRAFFELRLRANPRPEFDRLTVKPQDQQLGAWWPLLLARTLSDQVTIRWAPDSIPSETVLYEGFIESIEESGRPGEAELSFQLSPADLYQQFFQLGAAQLDSNASAVLAY